MEKEVAIGRRGPRSMSPSISDSGAGIANTTVIHASLEIGRVHANESSSTRSAISANEDVSVPKAVG